MLEPRTILSLLAALLFFFPQIGRAQALHLLTDFGGNSLPEGWESRQAAPNAAGWLIGTSDAARSNYFQPPLSTGMAYLNYDRCGIGCDGSEDWLISPVFQANNRAVYIEFDYFFYESTLEGFPERAWLLLLDGEEQVLDTLMTLRASGGFWRNRNTLLKPQAEGDRRLAIAYTDGGGWGRGIAINRFRLSAFPSPMASIDTVQASPYIRIQQEDTVRVRIRNLGPDTIQQVRWSWQLDSLHAVSERVDSVQLAPNASVVLTASQPFVLNAASESRLTLRLLLLDSMALADPDSARRDRLMIGVTDVPETFRVLETFVSGSCSLCPLTDLHRRDFGIQNRSFLPVAVYLNDTLALPEAAAWAERYGIEQAPFAVFDRQPAVEAAEPALPFSDWQRYLSTSLLPPPAKIYVSSKRISGSEVSLELELEALSQLDGNFRMGCLVVVDSVVRTASAFAQANDFNTIEKDGLFINKSNPNGTNPYYQKGNPIPVYVRYNVLLAALGGADGVLLPTKIPAGSRQRRAFPAITLPNFVRNSEVQLIPILLQADGKGGFRIAQAGRERLMELSLGVQADTILSCPGDTISLSAWCSDPNARLEWSPRTSLIDTVGLDVLAVPAGTTTFTVTAGTDSDTLRAMVRISFDMQVNFTTDRRYVPDSTTEIRFSNLTPNADSLVFAWDFGDSTFSELKEPAHRYKKIGIYAVSLIGWTKDSTCTDTMLRREWVDVGVGRKYPKVLPSLRIWPNPSAGQLSVSWPKATEHATRLLLYDLYGRIVARIEVPERSEDVQFTLPDLPDGLYFMRREDIPESTERVLLMRE